jgi:tRNA (cytidine/uridine-2'-O-)-methyltransferase
VPTLNIVLVEPQIPQNTGNVARTCAATGARLHLVEPMGFRVDDKKLKRAGLDYWYLLDITYYASWEEFCARNPGAQCFFFSTKARTRHSDVRYPADCYLVFGREDAGLPESLLLQHPERCVRLPMRGEARSLNLSNAVAVGVFEALRQWDYPALQWKGQLHNGRWEDAACDEGR